MIIERAMSRTLRLMFAGGLAVSMQAHAQIQSDPQSGGDDAGMQRVEVTGSSIKRLASETALPITTIKASDFVKQGLTTAAEVLNTISMNQSSTGSCLLYTSPSPRDGLLSRMPSSA